MRLHSRSSCTVSAALWLELGSGSQHGGFVTTPAFVHSSSSCPVSAALWLELGSGSQLRGFGATPALTRPPLVQSAQPCGSTSALDHRTEALEHTRPHSCSSCPVSVALWLELGSGSQHGGFVATPAVTRPPLVQSARPCGLNSARFAAVLVSNRK